MKLKGARVACSSERACQVDLSIEQGRIMPFDERPENSFEIDLSEHLILPGLINSHDHLEFNLFPRLGQGPHSNYMEWAAAIYHPAASPIREQLSVPKNLRLLWGGIKNLLSGVTTVSHHNRYHPNLFDIGFPVKVLQRYGWAHSTHFTPDFAARYASSPSPLPFLIHAGEGSCEMSRGEIDCLYRVGMLSDRTVLVHGVALDSRLTELLRHHGTSLVWCPSSNLFTLGRTLGRETLQSGLPVALGTDSALTGQGDLIDELQIAHDLGIATPTQLFQMVTTNAARILRLDNGEGEIRQGGVADLVVVADGNTSPAESLFGMLPELVIVGGKIKLVSSRLADRLPDRRKFGLEPIWLEGRGEYLVDANISKLHAAVTPLLGRDFRLAGRRIAA
jgi:cytosine/adenosine deaminase-related metal-dependent hydrolase